MQRWILNPRFHRRAQAVRLQAFLAFQTHLALLGLTALLRLRQTFEQGYMRFAATAQIN